DPRRRLVVARQPAAEGDDPRQDLLPRPREVHPLVPRPADAPDPGRALPRQPRAVDAPRHVPACDALDLLRLPPRRRARADPPLLRPPDAALGALQPRGRAPGGAADPGRGSVAAAPPPRQPPPAGLVPGRPPGGGGRRGVP